MLRSPRTKFCTSEHRNAFEAMRNAPAFEEAALAALLEFQASLPMTTTPNQAADCHNMMAGARRFLDILCTIHLPESHPNATKLPELNWAAGV